MLKNRQAPRGASDSTNLLKEYKITNILLAKWFRYASPNSFNGSTAKKDIIEGVNSVIKYIKEQDKLHIPPNNQ